MHIIGISHLHDSPTDAPASRPLTALEADLAGIWHEVLGRAPTQPNDHFFELGGNSLGVGRVAARIEARTGQRVSLPALFGTPTLAGMAAGLQSALDAPDAAAAPLTARLETGPVPASLSQERMWLLHELDAGGTAYSVVGALHLRGALDVAALEDSLRYIVERHEPLRTTFEDRDGLLYQRVNPPEFTVERRSLRGYADSAAQLKAATRDLQTCLQRPFDMREGPMIRVTLFDLADDHHILLLDLPHINSDAWSLGVLLEELIHGYEAQLAGRAPALPELPVQYRDYAVWQREWLRGDTLERLRTYWRAALQDLPALELPLDRPRPPSLTFGGATVWATLPTPLLERLRRVATAENATLFMVMLTAFKVLLSHWTGQTDVAVGTPVAGRSTPGVERMIGVFVNTLVMRSDLAGDPSFREALRRVRDTTVGAFDHQDMPFAQLVTDLQPVRDLSRSPLVQVMFNQINVPMPERSLPGLHLGFVELDRGGAQFDLGCTVTEISGEERVSLEYNTALFAEATMQALLDRFLRLLDEVSRHPDGVVSELPLLSGEERAQLAAWSGEPDLGDEPMDTVPELFEAQVRRTPDAVALRSGSAVITYRELNARANRLARHLRAHGVEGETPVAICLPRSVGAVVATLGVLKAGGAYVPLDPAHPPARLAQLLHDAVPRLLLGTAEVAGQVPTGEMPVLVVPLDGDDTGAAWAAHPADDLGVVTAPDALAYVMYTSGTSGTPKGVQGLHRGVTYRLRWMWDAFPFAAGEVCCLKTSAGFVDSVWELFGPLLAGVPLVLVPEQLLQDPPAFLALLAREEVTRVVLVPSLLRVLLEALENGPPLPCLTLWTASGEPLGTDVVAQFRQTLPHARLLNLYGSTEVAGDATWTEVTADGTVAPSTSFEPIGQPLPGALVYVVDAALRQVPPGTPGELLVGGSGLARGYHGQPDLTATRFVPNPHGPGQVFRTRDRAAFLPDGRLQVLGRLDRQVKVRGVRVEPEDVEARLLTHAQVESCAVTLSRGQDPVLVAYVVLRSPATPTELRAYLAAQLPSPAVPAHVVVLEQLPRTASGKLDRQRLPEPAAGSAAAVPPGTALERRLAELWAELLDVPVEHVGRHDSFFDLGGHSLLAARLVARLEPAFGVRVPLAALFRGPTIADLAAALDAATDNADTPLLVPLNPHGHRPPLFVLHGIGGHLTDLRDLTGPLGADQPLYGLEAVGVDGVTAPLDRVEAMAERYLHEIRRVQPHGPYFLCGHSFGGVVAFELAQQLRDAGEAVGLLALLDTWTPRPQDITPRHVLRGLKRVARTELTRARRSPAAALRWNARRIQVAARLMTEAARDRFTNQAGRAQRNGLPVWFQAVREANLQAVARYRARPLDVPTLLVQAEQRKLIEPLFAWADLIQGPIRVRTVGGTHVSMVGPQHVRQLGEALHHSLIAAQAGSGTWADDSA
ncbi:amino acid adenylation domain-containing protein [Deinococcus metalli]|uniref:Amino acid adenylation domain-containing protein n=1 Tax=Deinococcus metalli TaxID=1141878 RepID=A0A7W8NRU7_9DEIO|nr:non-ribosomal peptide synthetase [Deinococcus metalli]MBB5376492.1 amino acid adenylation domain-containing protein [Deinococcus metalli]GHF43631.1 hypothetical protein GCM10017781_20090 [Deinococcus metalli]